MIVIDRRHYRGRNAVWIQHGWLGHNAWFLRYGKEHLKAKFRDRTKIEQLAATLQRNYIDDVFPHVTPAEYDGRLPKMEERQATMFLDVFGDDFRVMPWVGGVLGTTVWPEDAE